MKNIREGDVYKVIELHGKSFELRYGFYEDFERESEYSEPIPIYPNFLKDPIYTDSGYPFATQMQDACEWLNSKVKFDACCADCRYFCDGEDLIGTCKCESRRKTSPTDQNVNKILSEDTV